MASDQRIYIEKIRLYIYMFHLRCSLDIKAFNIGERIDIRSSRRTTGFVTPFHYLRISKSGYYVGVVVSSKLISDRFGMDEDSFLFVRW